MSGGLGYKIQNLQREVNRLRSDAKTVASFPDKKFKFFGANAEILDMTEPEVLISGGAGTGKSLACLYRLHRLCCDYPNIRALIVRKTRASLAESGLHTFEAKVLGSGHPLLKGAHRQNRTNYVYPNGSRIVVAGMDKAEKIMSSDFDFIYIQEATEMSQEDMENLLSRLRNYVLPFQQLLMDCNPKSKTHWLYQRYLDGKMVLLKSVHEDNPLLFDHDTNQWTKEGIEYLTTKLDTMAGARYQRLRLGEWVSAEGVVYEFDPKRHILHGSLPSFKRFICGMDFGHRNAGALVCVGQTRNNMLVVVEEISRTEQQLDWWIRECQRVQEKYKPETYACDPSLMAHITALCAHGIPAIKGNNKIRFGVDLVQQRLKSNTLQVAAGSLKNKDPKLLDKHTPVGLVEEFDDYVWNDDKDLPIPRNNHSLDALRYAVVQIDRPMVDTIPATSTSYTPFKRETPILYRQGARRW